MNENISAFYAPWQKYPRLEGTGIALIIEGKPPLLKNYTLFYRGPLLVGIQRRATTLAPASWDALLTRVLGVEHLNIFNGVKAGLTSAILREAALRFSDTGKKRDCQAPSEYNVRQFLLKLSRWAADFPDGVWEVEARSLGGTPPPEEWKKLAAELEIHRAKMRTVRNRIKRHNRARRLSEDKARIAAEAASPT